MLERFFLLLVTTSTQFKLTLTHAAPHQQVIKLSAAALSTITKATTGISLSDLVPVDISSAISSATDVASFIEQYASIIGDSMDENDVEHPDWESIKPAEGIEGINTVLNTSKSSIQSVAGQSYREMANFLREMGFESSKLAMRLEFVNNEPRW